MTQITTVESSRNTTTTNLRIVEPDENGNCEYGFVFNGTHCEGNDDRIFKNTIQFQLVFYKIEILFIFKNVEMQISNQTQKLLAVSSLYHIHGLHMF